MCITTVGVRGYESDCGTVVSHAPIISILLGCVACLCGTGMHDLEIRGCLEAGQPCTSVSKCPSSLQLVG